MRGLDIMMLIWLRYYGLAWAFRGFLRYLPRVAPGAKHFCVHKITRRPPIPTPQTVLLYMNIMRTSRNELHTLMLHCWLDDSFSVAALVVMAVSLFRLTVQVGKLGLEGRFTLR